jgi:hypothetical protein
VQLCARVSFQQNARAEEVMMVVWCAPPTSSRLLCIKPRHSGRLLNLLRLDENCSIHAHACSRFGVCVPGPELTLMPWPKTSRRTTTSTSCTRADCGHMRAHAVRSCAPALRWKVNTVSHAYQSRECSWSAALVWGSANGWRP